MIARVGNDPCPLRLQNEWLSPCAASTLPSVGLEICASCATRGTCIRTHLFPTPCREAAITGFGDHPNASITRCIARAFGFSPRANRGDRPARYGRPAHRVPPTRARAECLLSGAKRKTSARREYFRFGPEADSDGLDQFASQHIVLVNSLLLPAVRLANASSSAMEGDWYVGCSRATFGNRRYNCAFQFCRSTRVRSRQSGWARRSREFGTYRTPAARPAKCPHPHVRRPPWLPHQPERGHTAWTVRICPILETLADQRDTHMLGIRP